MSEEVTEAVSSRDTRGLSVSSRQTNYREGRCFSLCSEEENEVERDSLRETDSLSKKRNDVEGDIFNLNTLILKSRRERDRLSLTDFSEKDKLHKSNVHRRSVSRGQKTTPSLIHD